MDCPLPIDWLDHLEGRAVNAPVDLAGHLADCRRCQALVAELRAQSVGVVLSPYGGRAEAPKWPAEERADVAVGDVWLTNSAEVMDERQLVMIVDERDEFDQTWYSAVPLTTETDLATDSDLLLDSGDTSLGVPFAAQFRLQTPLAREQLEVYVGEATDDALLARALAGELDDHRFGAPIARGGDTRLRRIEPTRRAMSELAVIYGEALTRAEEAAEEAVRGDEDSRVAEVIPIAPGAPRAVVIALKHVQPWTPRGALALAAEKAGLRNRWINYFAAEDERMTLRVQLVLENPMRSGEERLLLLIDEFSSQWAENIVIAVPKPTGERLQSRPFDPTREREVVVQEGSVGVLPAKVEHLEVIVGA
jgi:hypothetical protein